MLGRSDLDRCASERDDDIIARLLADPGTQIVVFRSGTAEVVDHALVRRAPQPDDDPDESLWVFLGRDADGCGYLAELTDAAPPPRPDQSAAEPGDQGADGTTWVGLRDIGHRLDDRDAGIFTASLALANWHAAHQHCPRCGAATTPHLAGWIRRCVADQSEHYPRTDPAIIVAVIDEDDRILLGHNAAWPDNRFSTLAGFVEPGESLEDAVRREVAEEAGVVVGEVRFIASQPWPFPASLMLGFVGCVQDPTISVDGEEVTEARWFSREELATEILAGTVIPPGGVSIARRLVEYWFGGPIPEGPHRW